MHTHIHTPSLSHIQTHTLTCTHTETHVHTLTCTHRYTYSYTYIHTHTDTHTHTLTHTGTHTYLHIHTHTYTHIHSHKHTETHIHTCIHTFTHIHPFTDKHTHTVTHTHTHAHSHIHMHILSHTQSLTKCFITRYPVLLSTHILSPMTRLSPSVMHTSEQPTHTPSTRRSHVPPTSHTGSSTRPCNRYGGPHGPAPPDPHPHPPWCPQPQPHARPPAAQCTTPFTASVPASLGRGSREECGSDRLAMPPCGETPWCPDGLLSPRNPQRVAKHAFTGMC